MISSNAIRDGASVMGLAIEKSQIPVLAFTRYNLRSGRDRGPSIPGSMKENDNATLHN
jgi:hypothetical protein